MSITRITDLNVRFDEKALARERTRPAPQRLTRRTLLRATAASIALPPLASLLRPAELRAQGSDPLRFVAWHIGCGVWGPSWYPEASGTDYELTPSLASLASIRDKVMVLSGIQNREACESTGSHGCGPPAMTTCRQGTKPDIRMGISVDQVYAQALGTATRIPSLQLTVTDRTFADVQYPAVYNGTISWASDTQPLPPVVDPALIFDKIFADGDNATGDADAAAALAKRRALRRSVLDHVSWETDVLVPRLGVSDRRKLDEYLTGVRALEQQIQNLTPESTVSCTSDDLLRPEETSDVPELTRIMLDLMVMAFRCDATRVITFMQGNGGNTSFARCPWLNISEDHHGLSHHQGDPAKGAKLAAIDQWEVEQYAYFLERMNEVQEGERTMLDNSVIFLSSEISDGDRHNQQNKPILLAGSAGGQITTGRHVVFDEEPQPDLFIALLNMLGVPVTSFGTAGTKALTGLV